MRTYRTLSLSLPPSAVRALEARGAREDKTAARIAAEIVLGELAESRDGESLAGISRSDLEAEVRRLRSRAGQVGLRILEARQKTQEALREAFEKAQEALEKLDHARP